MFHGVSFRLLKNPPLDQITNFYARLRQDGCDAISIIPHHYVWLEPNSARLAQPPADFNLPWFIYPDQGQEPCHPFHNTPEPELVLEACRAAEALGFSVMLKPHVDSYHAAWRGYIEVQHVSADWVWAYKNRFLARYVDIAKQLRNPILCIGTELYTVSKQLGADFWIGIADWVRSQGYSGRLTYAANWGGWGDDAEYNRLADLWPRLDYIGVDAYFPLVPQNYSGPLDALTLAGDWHRKGLEVDWLKPIDDDLLAISNKSGKPLLFTEIGYGNHQSAASDPMRDPLPSDVRDDALQLALTEAFRQRWGVVPGFEGYFWWEAWLDQDNKPLISHDIIDRPVEQIVFKLLPGEPGAPVAPVTPPVIVEPPITPPGPTPVTPPTPTQPTPAGGLDGSMQPTPPTGTPSTTVAAALALNGVHGPNSHFAAFRSIPFGPTEGTDSAWRRVVDGNFSWIKLLWPDHSPADAARAKAQHMKVLVRAPGEGIVHFEQVQQIMAAFGDKCDVIEIGNEPGPNAQFGNWKDLLWNHLAFLDLVADHCLGQGTAKLITPGWRADFLPPLENTVVGSGADTFTIPADLAAKFKAVYSRFDGIGVHSYASADLTNTGAQQHLDNWHNWLPDKPLYITEYGIGLRWLSPVPHDPGKQAQSDAIKAAQYVKYLRQLASRDYVKAAFLFILGGTEDFAAFDVGHYLSTGGHSYWLVESAYKALGAQLNSTGLTIGQSGDISFGLGDGPAHQALHVGIDDRPHGPAFALASAPTISPDVFASQLQRRGSPALAEANALDYYRVVQDAGLNPAVALAFFGKESEFGTYEHSPAKALIAAKNWGNIRSNQDPAQPPGGRATHRVNSNAFGWFRGYATWLDGLRDWCDLMRSDTYRGKSLVAALRIYAPGSDGNRPDDYANIVNHWVAQWDQQSGAFDIPGDSPIPVGNPGATGAYTLLGQPTISQEVFANALLAARSPVLQEIDAATYYQICVANGVDPAVVLAFFAEETAWGAAPGVAAQKNWGNLWDRTTGTVQIYSSWVEGLRDWCRRLQGPAYTAAGAPTIASIVPIYRPAGARENGNPWYINHLIRHLNTLLGLTPDGQPRGTALGAGGTSFDLPPEPGGISFDPAGGGSDPFGEFVGTNGFNFDPGRHDSHGNVRLPIAIVNHVMIGNMTGTIAKFGTNGAKASSSYAVGANGRVVQFVRDENTAWANGPIRNPNSAVVPWIAEAQQQGIDPNALCISIEWEGTHHGGHGGEVEFNHARLQVDFLKGTIPDSGFWQPGEAQYQAGLRLIRALCAKHNIPMDRAHIGRHSDLDSVRKWFCPGQNFPLQRLLDDLRGAAPPPPPQPTPTPPNPQPEPTPPDPQPEPAPVIDPPQPDMPMFTVREYHLLGAPTISPAVFAGVLSDAGSPALGETGAQDYYTICTSNNIDPALALAFFGQENNYGAAPDAAPRKNWGNLWDAQANAFQVYDSWRLGLVDWCRRLILPPYTNSNPITVDSIVPLYRGARDDNDAYAAAVRFRIDALRNVPQP